jgi:hypothetical protein
VHNESQRELLFKLAFQTQQRSVCHKARSRFSCPRTSLNGVSSQKVTDDPGFTVPTGVDDATLWGPEVSHALNIIEVAAHLPSCWPVGLSKYNKSMWVFPGLGHRGSPHTKHLYSVTPLLTPCQFNTYQIPPVSPTHKR